MIQTPIDDRDVAEHWSSYCIDQGWAAFTALVIGGYTVIDVAGARREPHEGESMHGLYQHKLSFGGRWLQLAGAHERVIRSNRYAAGRLLARARRVLPLPG